MKSRFIVFGASFLVFAASVLIVGFSVKFLYVDSYNRYNSGICRILSCSEVARSCSNCKRQDDDDAVIVVNTGVYAAESAAANSAASGSGSNCDSKCFDVTVRLELNGTSYQNTYSHTFSDDPKLCPSKQVTYKPPVIAKRDTECYYDPHRINETLSLIHPQVTVASEIVISIFSFIGGIALLVVIVSGLMSTCYMCESRHEKNMC